MKSKSRFCVVLALTMTLATPVAASASTAVPERGDARYGTAASATIFYMSELCYKPFDFIFDGAIKKPSV